jgi:hypothetical protein
MGMNNTVFWGMKLTDTLEEHAVSFFREGEVAFSSAVLTNFLENSQHHITVPFIV